MGWSLVGDLLKFADPNWVQKLASGTTWLLVSILVGFVAGVTVGIAAAALGPSAGSLMVLAVQALAAILSVVGYWLFTEPEPVEKYGEPVRSRLWARWGCLLSIVLGFTAGIMGLAEPTTSMVIGVVGQIAGIIGFFALFVYARRLALRIPDLSLASQTRVVMWGLVVLMGLGAVFAVVMVTALAAQANPGNPSGPGVSAIGGVAAFGCVFALGYLIFGIWALVLLVMYRNRFTTQTQEARRTWAARQPA